MQALGTVAGKVDKDVLLRGQAVDALVIGGVFGRDHHLIAVVALLHPGADPLLGLLKLVIVGRVEEVTSLLKEVVEDFLGGLLITGSHW